MCFEFNRNKFQHWAVYIGGGWVIHFSGRAGQENGEKSDATIHRAALNSVIHVSDIRINNSYDFAVGGSRVFTPAQIVERAESRLGESGYELFDNNCEHFARWCRNAAHESTQADRYILSTIRNLVRYDD